MMLLPAAMLLNTCANAQWVLTGNPTATNTSILGATGAGINLRIFAGGTAAANERIRITGSNGNVGIGTTAPTTKLHVVGTTRLQGATTVVGLTTTTTLKVTGGSPGLDKLLRSDAAGLASWITNPVGTNANNRIPKWNGTQLVTGTLFDNGSIGIGNTSPGANLHITPNSSTFAFRIDQGVNGQGQLTYVNTTDPAKIVFAAASNATGMYVFGDGHAGLGSGSAPSRLTIADGSVSSSIPIVDVATNAAGTSADVRGIRSTCVMNPGWGFGLEATGGFIGVSANADATTYTGGGYGIIASATGSAGVRYGVYGSASNTGGEAWGGYFPTKTYTSELRVGGEQGATGYVASINGKLIATEVRVALQSSWPDYVFANDYQLMDIHQLEQSIKAENHLPGMPSACEVEENGLHLGEMQSKIVEKLEESHLYIIQLQKQIDELKAQVNELKK